jgi:hypothetical protein
MKVECGIVSCVYNKPFDAKYGYCEYDKNIVLKFRLAADMGKGTIVMVECLNMVLPESQDAA